MFDELFEDCREIREQGNEFPEDLIAVIKVENLEQANRWIKRGWDDISDFVHDVGEEPEVLIGKWVMAEDIDTGPQSRLEEMEESIVIYTVVHNRPYSEKVTAYTDGEHVFVSEAYFI